LSVATEIRALMGEELGSAPPISFRGHFNAYYTPDYIRNTTKEVPDSDYIQAVEDSGGWGGINHPHVGGNQWRCWYPAPDRGCPQGAADFAAPALAPTASTPSLVAIELTNGGRFPPPETLAQWDEYLRQGYAVWAVGASDAHTLSRGVDTISHIKGQPEENKLGSSKTFVYVPEYAPPGEGYSSTDPDDPVRRAIATGRTVASNGGFAVAEVTTDQASNVLPGGTVNMPTEGEVPIVVVVGWEQNFSGSDPPESVRIVFSQVGEQCRDHLVCESRVRTLTPTAEQIEQGRLEEQVILPVGWTAAYIRVEVLGTFEVQDVARPIGAFVSPVFINRSSSADV
jgi:hypothetical protein